MNRFLALVTLLLSAVLAPSGASAAHGVPRVTTARPAPCIGRCWRPPVETTFFWQLQGVVRAGQRVDAYDIDAVDTPTRTVTALRRRGYRTVCYVSAGSWEAWRADAGDFPDAVLGEELDGWPGERWLDVRQLAVLQPILRARIQACAAKGFDGIEFDNVDGYTNETGFPLTVAHQLRYDRWLADEAHRNGLAVGLKNSPEQVPRLVKWFDFAVVEQCFQYAECASYSPFVAAKKPVFVAEYELAPARFCPQAKRLRMSAARYPLLLNGVGRTPCPWPA